MFQKYVNLKSYFLRCTLFAALFLGGFSTALWMVIHPSTKLLLLKAHLIEQHVIPRDNLQRDPREVPCPKGAHVLILGGQSNAANQGGTRGRFPTDVLNFYQGHCFTAVDPLLGASGDQGSVWSRVSWREPTILVPVAIGQTRIAEWTPGGPLWPRVLSAMNDLQAAGLKADTVWWHQGESDAMAGVSPEQYANSLRDLIGAFRNLGVKRIVVATASKCMHVQSIELTTGQRRTILENGAILGPETDSIGDQYRRDGCHFNDAGMKMAGAMWSRYL